mmetsp:Transcript_104629/g.302774  ORF Transcript_104629/g.302774 Transcript_104629/m.302774 type:complete len:503 (+) Transcript_104629:81-1589(+)
MGKNAKNQRKHSSNSGAPQGKGIQEQFWKASQQIVDMGKEFCGHLPSLPGLSSKETPAHTGANDRRRSPVPAIAAPQHADSSGESSHSGSWLDVNGHEQVLEPDDGVEVANASDDFMPSAELSEALCLAGFVHPCFARSARPRWDRLATGVAAESAFDVGGVSDFADELCEALRSNAQQLTVNVPKSAAPEHVMAAIALACWRDGRENLAPSVLFRGGNKERLLLTWEEWRGIKPEDHRGSCATLPLERQSAACASLTATFNASRNLSQLLDRTHMVDRRWSGTNEGAPHLAYYEEGVLDLVAEFAGLGKKVAVVATVSNGSIGEGLLKGSCQGLAEALCRQTTLFFSLAKAERELREAEREHRGGRSLAKQLMAGDAVVSPLVEVCCEGPVQRHARLPSPLPLAGVVSIAEPLNCPNAAISFAALLRGSAMLEAEVLLVPDLRRADLFWRAVASHGGHLRRVVCTGSPTFFDGVRAARNGNGTSSAARAVVEPPRAHRFRQ